MGMLRMTVLIRKRQVRTWVEGHVYGEMGMVDGSLVIADVPTTKGDGSG